MNRAYRAELLKLRRPGTAAGIGLVASLAVLSTVLAFALAKTGPVRRADNNGFTLSRSTLTRPGGLTAGFVTGMTLVGLLVFVVTAIAITTEYGQGTLRVLLTTQPRRLAWLTGRLAAVLTVIAAALLAALVAGVAAALVMSQLRNVSTAGWFTASGLERAAGDYLNALLCCAFFTVAGTAVGILTRSTTLALAIGIAWMFPLEHIVGNAWAGATRVFPGLLFNAVGLGGVPDAGYLTALTRGLLYTAVGLVALLVSFARRDVTA